MRGRIFLANAMKDSSEIDCRALFKSFFAKCKIAHLWPFRDHDAADLCLLEEFESRGLRPSAEYMPANAHIAG
jgi:hypothetical protein